MIPGRPAVVGLDPVQCVAGRAAHEIGSAATAIQIALERLERARREGRGEADAWDPELVREQLRRLASLAHRLRELASPPAVLPAPTELNREVERILGPFRRELARRGIEIRFRPHSGTVFVNGDPNRLREALLALLGNAERAVALRERPPEQEGPAGWIEVRVLPGPAGGGEVRIRDSGPGVRAGEEEWIFLPFASGWGGDGLGLCLSREAAVRQGGTLAVHRDGEGRSEFVLSLEPCSVEEER
jgi:signal transduction histidine kinase